MPPRAEAAASEAGAVSLSGAIAARPADVAGSLDGDVRRPSEAKSEVRAPPPARASQVASVRPDVHSSTLLAARCARFVGCAVLAGVVQASC